jgi:hypothetical protein
MNDSILDTTQHIRRVMQLMNEAAIEMLRRANVHDDSKLKEPEKSGYDGVVGALKGMTYGSEEYREQLKKLKPTIQEHYKNNTHHPEHYERGVDDFDLFDLMEMFFDWKAASERHDDGNIYRSIVINRDRHNLSEQICSIFENTARRLGWKR